MFDNTNFTAAGASEPPKPAKPVTYCEPLHPRPGVLLCPAGP